MIDLHELVGRCSATEHRVEDDHTAISVGSGSLAVLGSPVLIAWIEEATVDSLALDPGSTSVGVHIDVAHLAATPVGSLVTCEAEVVKVDGLRVTFRVGAVHDFNDKVIATGTIDRVVVDEQRFLAALASGQMPVVERG